MKYYANDNNICVTLPTGIRTVAMAENEKLAKVIADMLTADNESTMGLVKEVMHLRKKVSA